MWPKIVGVIITIVSAIVSAFIFLDTTYLHAETFEKFQVSQNNQIMQLQNSMELQNLSREKSMLEREILKLEVKRDATPANFNSVDKAFLERLKDDVKDIKKDIEAVKTRSQDRGARG